MRRVIAVVGLFLVGMAGSGCNTGSCLRNSDCASFLVCAPAGDCVMPPDAAHYDGDGTLIVPIDAHVDARIDADDHLPLFDAAPVDAARIDAISFDATPDPFAEAGPHADASIDAL